MDDVSNYTFVQCQAAMHRLEQLVAKASDANHLRALLLADIGSPLHSFGVLALPTPIINLADRLCDLMLQDLDEGGAPV